MDIGPMRPLHGTYLSKLVDTSEVPVPNLGSRESSIYAGFGVICVKSCAKTAQVVGGRWKVGGR